MTSERFCHLFQIGTDKLGDFCFYETSLIVMFYSVLLFCFLLEKCRHLLPKSFHGTRFEASQTKGCYVHDGKLNILSMPTHERHCCDPWRHDASLLCFVALYKKL